MMLKPFGISTYFSLESLAAAAVGGAILGATVIFKTAMTGRVLGVSSSTSGLISQPNIDRLAFVAGLVVAGLTMTHAYGATEPVPPAGVAGASIWWLRCRLLLGGLLVGVGSATGKGCTSGHGLTGLARLSRRSWVAVPVFMASGVLAATLMGTSGALPPDAASEAAVPSWPTPLAAAAAASAALLGSACVITAAARRWNRAAEVGPKIVELVSGLTFGCGLVVSGMGRPSKVAGFLDLGSGAWDPSLMFVMGAALALTTPYFQVLERMLEQPQPAICSSFELPPTTNVDLQLCVGATLFGLGWGTCGVCPGPVWVLIGASLSIEVAIVWFGMFLGMGIFVVVQRVRASRQKSDVATAVVTVMDTSATDEDSLP